VLQARDELLGLNNDFLLSLSKQMGKELRWIHLESAIQLEVVTTNLTLESHLADDNVTITALTESKALRDASTKPLFVKIISDILSL
jgi:hypothetical protein